MGLGDFFIEASHLRSDPACKLYDEAVAEKAGNFVRSLSCQPCMQDRRKASAQQDAAAPQAPVGSPVDWEAFEALLGQGDSSAPRELPGEVRGAQSQMFAQYQGWIAAGFSQEQAFQLLHGQFTTVIAVKARWTLEQGGGA